MEIVRIQTDWMPIELLGWVESTELEACAITIDLYWNTNLA